MLVLPTFATFDFKVNIVPFATGFLKTNPCMFTQRISCGLPCSAAAATKAPSTSHSADLPAYNVPWWFKSSDLTKCETLYSFITILSFYLLISQNTFVLSLQPLY